MLDINLIRSNPKWVQEQLAKRGCQVDFAPVIALDSTRRNLIQRNEARRQKRNENSALIAKLKKEGKDATKQIAEMKAIGDKIAHGDAELAKLEQKIFDTLAPLPNIPLPEVVAGGKENNKVVATFGKKPELKQFENVLSDQKSLEEIAAYIFNNLRPSEQQDIHKMIEDSHLLGSLLKLESLSGAEKTKQIMDIENLKNAIIEKIENHVGKFVVGIEL